MASRGKALSSAGPHASIPTALPVPIRLMISQSSCGWSGLGAGKDPTNSKEHMTSRECDPVQSSDHLLVASPTT
eukprot:13003260-Heterocapsa_arctica.AAC.1